MRKRWRWLGLLAAGAIGAGAWGWAAHLPQDKTETIGFTRPLVTAPPALCPWRSPQSDLRAFFPGADRYETRLMALSSLRLPIQRRLGASLESNALSAFPVFQGAAPRGAVLIGRAAGEYGAMEIVVGVDEAGRVRGVRIQRLREPDPVAQALTDPAWLRAFRGKTADDTWQLGADIPNRLPASRASAQIVLRTVRALLIEYDAARRDEEKRV